MHTESTATLKKHLGQLFIRSLGFGGPLQQLQLIREKLEARSLQNFDKEDILQELGKLQHRIGELNSEMLCIHDLLKQENQWK